MNRCPRKTGFTLIELLVVVAIISLLLAILAPTLGRARYSVASVECVNAKKQFVYTGVNYAVDHKGRYPNFHRGMIIHAPHDIEWYMPAILWRDYGMVPEWILCTFNSDATKESFRTTLKTNMERDPNFNTDHPYVVKWILPGTTYWVERGARAGGWSDHPDPNRHIISDLASKHTAADAVLTDSMTDPTSGSDPNPPYISKHQYNGVVSEIAEVFGDGSARMVPVSEAENRFYWWHPPFAW